MDVGCVATREHRHLSFVLILSPSKDEDVHSTRTYTSAKSSSFDGLRMRILDRGWQVRGTSSMAEGGQSTGK